MRSFDEVKVLEQSDTELFFLALDGDNTAFGQLVWRYQPMAQQIAS